MRVANAGQIWSWPVYALRIAIQGELGSNSHAAALAMFVEPDVEVVPCNLSAHVFALVMSGAVDGAVLPIENSLHGAVAEHYDLLLQKPVRIAGETLLRVRHTMIVRPGVQFGQVRRVLSHPVALAQCRHFFEEHPEVQAVPFYDTAGSVKHVMEEGLEDTAAIAPPLAALHYGGVVIQEGLEDHEANFTRFHWVVREEEFSASIARANKMSVAFSVEHRPGTLVAALDLLRQAGIDLTRIESRPVPGTPWEYVFFVELRFRGSEMANDVLEKLRSHCGMVKELGRYMAASKPFRS